MDDWPEMRWLRRHAMVAPFGIFAATLLLTLYLKQWHWHGRESWQLATGQVDLGAVLYAMGAVLVERGVRLMFWALDERRKWRAQWRAAAMAEGHAVGLAEGRTTGRAEGRTEGQAEGRAEERDRVQALLSQYARRDPETGELILVLDRDAEERLRNGNSNGQG